MSEIHTRIPAILLFGTLSVFFAEVLSGASNLWFIDAWGLLIVLPLYLSHALFFLNLAIKQPGGGLGSIRIFEGKDSVEANFLQ